ncbi:splicing factor, CC1-like protein [Ceraceosorus guamensis]|uniref:Splicing factor, CC1-like protein n=1 Tax=Ceraceosorus guamensis TaxID=1522189 RepID=A0A316WAL9_9BASI|nr:splicing factor, CC1-like protein [Ceraceosorus guamensis]PWN45013.1 splicing factor, CC1-like protein [Ceraceosorus guamensis]
MYADREEGLDAAPAQSAPRAPNVRGRGRVLSTRDYTSSEVSRSPSPNRAARSPTRSMSPELAGSHRRDSSHALSGAHSSSARRSRGGDTDRRRGHSRSASPGARRSRNPAHRNGRHRNDEDRSRSPASRSPSRTPSSRSSSTAPRARAVSNAEREAELAEKLRRRAAGSKNGPRDSRGRSVTRSPSPRRSRSRSPTHSRRGDYEERDGAHRRRKRDREDYEGGRASLERRLEPRLDDRRSERGSSRISDRYERDRYYDRGPARTPHERSRGGYDRDPYARDRYPSRGVYDREPYGRDRYGPRGGGGYDRDSYASRRREDGPYHSPRHGSRGPLPPEEKVRTPEPEDYELRSVFCSQLAARLGQRDLGEFFEEALGDNSVRDVRIVTDRITGRSKGIGYVELKEESLVEKAMALSGTKLFGIPILVQQTEAARNRGEGASTAQAPIRPNLPPHLGGTATSGSPPAITESLIAGIPLPPHFSAGAPIHLGQNLASVAARAKSHANQASRLYVGSLHFEITDTDLKSVFDPFGTIESVDLHREPTGKSKGFAFIQFTNVEDAERAIQHMDNFELAGRNIRVGHVNARGQEGRTMHQQQAAVAAAAQQGIDISGQTATTTSSFDEGGGGGLTSASRAALMEKLARTEQPALTVPTEQTRPANMPVALSRAILLKNMFNPEEETERDWDKELAEEVKGECEEKYGVVEACYVDKESAGEIWVRFAGVEGAGKAINALNGRFFAGRKVVAQYVSEGIMQATMQG